MIVVVSGESSFMHLRVARALRLRASSVHRRSARIVTEVAEIQGEVHG